MAITIYTNEDIKPGAIAGQRIAIIGYGSQGRAHAQNLKDSGHDVIAGVRHGGKGWRHATEDGVPTAEPAEAVRGADIIAILTPDMAQAEIYRTVIESHAKMGAAILFAHGFSIHYGRIAPREDMDVILVAPKGPGTALRQRFSEGSGLLSLVAGGIMVVQPLTGAISLTVVVAAWLMVPYMVWLSFAAGLNWQFGRLNPDAQSLVPGARTYQVIG